MVQSFPGSDFTMIPRDSECCLRIVVCRWFVLPQSALPNFVAMSNALETNGRARLLPSLIRHGSAGASPSQAMNGLVKNDLMGKATNASFQGIA